MLLDKMRGGLLGLAAGDALGVPVEFCERSRLKKDPVTDMRGWGTHSQPPGTWSDDTGMTLAALDSLTGGFDPEDMMRCFSRWRGGEYWPYGEVFDVGIATEQAISRYRGGTPALLCGGRGERDNGNGSLMRMLPVAYYLYLHQGTPVFRGNSAQIVRQASAVTHAHPRSQIACMIYVGVACALLAGRSARSAAQEGVLDAVSACLDTDLEPELEHYALLADVDAFCALPDAAIASSGYVVHTLQAALYCLNNARSFRDCALAAVNLGDDTDTTAAVAGSLAGIAWGEGSIPAAWRMLLPRRGEMERLLEIFYYSQITKK